MKVNEKEKEKERKEEMVRRGDLERKVVKVLEVIVVRRMVKENRTRVTIIKVQVKGTSNSDLLKKKKKLYC